MSSLNDCIKCIKFHLNIEDPNIIFSDYFKKWINGKYHNLYLSELIQPHCPYCYSSNLKHNGHYTSKRKILSALTEDRSMTSIAREHNVSVNTVRRVLESCSSKFYDDLGRLPKPLTYDATYEAQSPLGSTASIEPYFQLERTAYSMKESILSESAPSEFFQVHSGNSLS